MERDQLTRDLVRMSGEMGLNLQYIQVTGRSHTPTEMLVAATDIKLGQPMLGYHWPKYTAILCRSVGLSRDCRAADAIDNQNHDHERIPALLQTRNGHELIDRTGTIIEVLIPPNFRI